MSIQINDFEVERKVNRAIQKMKPVVRPTKQQFIANAVTTYIETLVKERIISSL